MKATRRIRNICISAALPFLLGVILPSTAQAQRPQLGAVSFSCLQYDDDYDGEMSSDVVLVERSSNRVPLPSSDDTCMSYLVRLKVSEAPAGNQASLPFPPVRKCSDLIEPGSFRPPSAQAEYGACISYLLYGWW